MTELLPRLIDLARRAKAHDLNFTVDAEEADRLELSLDVIAAVLADASLEGWDGFGLAIQAYQKRASDVIDYVDGLARTLDRRMMVRLVKGAYWDTEIKRAQERGLDDYPVFTRKAMTDLNYVACARKLLALRPRIFPQFATHNALTVATVLELADGEAGFEFQRLHGMGEALYAQLSRGSPGTGLPHLRAGRQPPRSPGLSGAAAIGERRQLVLCRARRRREHAGRDAAAPAGRHHRHARERAASGYRLAARSLPAAARRIHAASNSATARRWTNCVAAVAARVRRARSAQHADATSGRMCTRTIAAAPRRLPAWSRTAAESRAVMLERAADLLEQRARAFHRAAATRGRQDPRRRALGSPRGRRLLPLLRRRRPQAVRRRRSDAGPHRREQCAAAARPRRVRRDIAVEFSAGDFFGPGDGGADGRQCVVAKPAEQTPLIAAEAIRLLHEAGIPASALHLVPGDGRIGAALVAHPDIAGVVFTGSTEVARSINRTLAAKDGPIVPLIAETGGINAMIVDATALPEQVADDVVTSAFRSAGQRCSALRLLFVQDDVADRMIEMIAGAARELSIGDPARSRRAGRPGDRRRGQAAAGCAYRAHEERGPGAFCRRCARRQFCRAAYFRIVRAPISSPRRCSVRCCMWCATPPTGSTACCNRSSAPAMA